MGATVKAGFAMNNGVTVIMEEDATITFQPANTQPRIDRVVLRNNDDVQERRTSIVVLTGTPSASPEAPAYTRNATIHDLVLADVRIGANVTSVAQSAITDRRLDSSVCGIVAGTIEEIDTSTLYAQIQADLAELKEEQQTAFTTWFNGVQDDFEGFENEYTTFLQTANTTFNDAMSNFNSGYASKLAEAEQELSNQLEENQATFDTWFDSVKDSINEDEALHLQNQINALDEVTSNTELEVDGLQETVADHETRIDTLETDTTNLDSRVDYLEENGVAVGDTLPIGSVVYLEDDDTPLPTGYEETEVIPPTQLLVNTDFQINQRNRNEYDITGTVQLTRKYGPDRWYILKHEAEDTAYIEMDGSAVHNEEPISVQLGGRGEFGQITRIPYDSYNDITAHLSINGVEHTITFENVPTTLLEGNVYIQKIIYDEANEPLLYIKLYRWGGLNVGGKNVLTVFLVSSSSSTSTVREFTLEYFDLWAGRYPYPHQKKTFTEDYLESCRTTYRWHIPMRGQLAYDNYQNLSRFTGCNFPVPMWDDPSVERCSLTMDSIDVSDDFNQAYNSVFICESFDLSGQVANIKGYILFTCEPM